MKLVMEHIQTLLLKEAHVSCQAPHHIPVVKKQRMKWTVLPFCLIHIMASFNLLKAITVFIGKKKKKKQTVWTIRHLLEWNWELSEANVGKKKI